MHKSPTKRASAKKNESATLTTSSGPVNLLGLPGPFRFESYCETNDGYRWKVGGLGEVLFLGAGPSRRYQLASKLPFNGDLYGVYFNDQGLGWIVGDRGVIFHTPDKGNTWIEQSVGGEEPLYAVTCANKETCWAVGNNGLILRTTDAGKVWMKIETKNEEPLNAIDFIDTKTGWIATNYNGIVLHTTDGGLTWERQRVPLECRHPCDKWGEAIHAIRFVNDRVGWAASVDQIARTEDGGRTWKVTFADEGDSLTRIVGLVAHDEKKVWAIDEHGQNLFSDDGGRKWSTGPLEQPITSSLNPKDFGEVLTFSTIDGIGDKCVMVYGGPSLGSRGYLIQDCGDAQWKRKWSYDNGYIRSMSFLDDAKGWLVIGHGLVKVERVKEELEATIVRNDPNDGIESVFFINDLYGWTCGDKGSIHRTEDGGVTWKQQVTPTDVDLKEIRFMNGLEGWARGAEERGGRVESVILTTADGGATWVTSDTADARELSNVFFLSPRHACGIGDNNSILCTTDGENWRVRYRDSGARKLKRAIFFANEKKGWVAGDGIWHTSDGGLTWEQQLRPPNTETLENVVFANDKLGWANTLQAVWRTTDGGRTWTRVSDTWLPRLASNR